MNCNVTPWNINLFKHNVEKWPNIIEKSCGVNTARCLKYTTRFLKYVWPFFTIIHERIKSNTKCREHDKIFFWKSEIKVLRFKSNSIKIGNILFDRLITAQKMKFSIKDFSSKCDEIRSFQQIWSHFWRNP